MAVTTAAAVKNGRLDAISVAWGATPKLRLYSGSMPANSDAALSSNTLLAEVTPAPVAASGGVKNMLGSVLATTGQAGAAGGTLATFYRVYKTDGTTCVEQGTVGLAGSTPDMVIDNTSIASGQTVNFNSWTKTEP